MSIFVFVAYDISTKVADIRSDDVAVRGCVKYLPSRVDTAFFDKCGDTR